tara:strand:+ start:5534 stop:5830 length:297 start_codon:yes stop_codon:yes gene_type:complete
MNLKSLIEILYVANIHKTKIKSLLWDFSDGDDDMVDRVCEYYLSLRSTIIILEEILQSDEAETGHIENIEMLSQLYVSVNSSSRAETRLSERVNILSH